VKLLQFTSEMFINLSFGNTCFLSEMSKMAWRIAFSLCIETR